MPAALALSLSRDCSLAEHSPGEVTVAGPLGMATLRGIPAGIFAALSRMADGPVLEHDLADAVRRVDGPGAAVLLQVHLERLKRVGLLAHTLLGDDTPLLTIQPTSRQFRLEIQPIGDSALTLSRFAYLHRDGTDLVLESPLALCSVVCQDRRTVALLHALSSPGITRDLLSAGLDLPPDALRLVLGALAATGFASPVAADGAAVDDSLSLRQWEFHDLLFHARSRSGRFADPDGRIYRFLGAVPPLPALKERSSVDILPLYRPDLLALSTDDRPFAEVMEARTSTRAHGDPPITARQLGEFLYRAARVRRVIEADLKSGVPHQTTSRPYPDGGAVYELELYLAVARCTDVPPGLYHYDPLDHSLERLVGLTPDVAVLLSDAQQGIGMADTPQILIILAARFQRVSWKYKSIAYALILKDVGVLYQTMYLVATALGLAASAAGGGDSDLFARAAGTDYLAETSVGEFLLGSCPGPAPNEASAD